MADVNVTVMIDGKAVFVHGAANAPLAGPVIVAGLDAARAHFQAIKDASTPATSPVPAAKPQDASL
jgi:hypothetical protein